MSRSLKVRLLAGTAAVTALALAAAALAVYFSVRVSLLAEFDAALGSQASAVVAATEKTATGIYVEIDAATMPEFSRPKHPDYCLMWADGVSAVYRSPSAAGADFTKPAIPGGAAYSFVRLPNGRPGRVITLRFAPRVEDEDNTAQVPVAPPTVSSLVLQVARETRSVDKALSSMALLLVSVTAAAVLMSTVLMALVVRRGLRPVDALAGRIASVGEHDLSARLDHSAAPTELRPVIDRLNDLLARLELAFTREKSFSADVAHELRTPLAGLEAALEVCASRRREPEAYEQTVLRCLSAVRDMHAMMEKLLLLARFESRQLPISPEPVNLGEIVAGCLAPIGVRAAARRLRIQVEIPTDLSLKTDPAHLRIILQNLFDNAVSYADELGTIQVSGVASEADAVLRVSNTGSTLSNEDAERAFDRLWRADVSRSQTGLHCGLGLSLARRIAQALHGSLSATSSPGGTFEAVLTLPRST